MKRLKKFIITMAAVLMILSVPLSAVGMTVRWVWALDDPAVTAYRYQLDGEDADGWTLLPADTDSLEISGLDPQNEYTLYLQRSYDGVNWSPSASSTAKADLAAQPDVRIYRFEGYELKASIWDGRTVIEYPSSATDEDVITFFAIENEKYGYGDLGVVYTMEEGSSVAFTYPAEFSRAAVVSELDALVNDLVAYVTTPVPAPAEAEPAEEPVAAEPVAEEPAAAEEPIIRTYSYAGFELTAEIATGTTVIDYPAAATDDEVNTFFAIENEKYGLGDLGVYYTLEGDGRAVFTYPEEYSKETVAAELDKLVDDLIVYITTPVPAPVEEETVEEPAGELAAEEPAAAEEPIVRTYSYAGFELTAEIAAGTTVIDYPAVATDDEVNTFFAIENEKYGLGDLGVYYTLEGNGRAVFTYPEEYSKETVASELDKLVDDLIVYITTPAPEPASEETEADEPLHKVYEAYGYTLEATVDTGLTTLVYPAEATDDDVIWFFALENEKYGLGDLGVTYAFGTDENTVLIYYPETYAKEEVASELDMLVDDLIAIVAPAESETAEAPEAEESIETPAAPEPEVPAVAPVTPVVIPEEEDGPFAFSLLIRGGVASSFDRPFKFNGPIFAEAGLGFNFSSIIPAGEHVGFGLRSDLVVNFLPKATGKWDLADNLEYFNIFNYAEMTSLDLKLMMDIISGPMDLYIAGGVGFAVGNPHDNAVVTDYLSLGTFSAGSVSFAMDWFASATAGIRFYIGDVFSIGAEINYRYIVESQKHMGSADLVLGFTF